MFGILLSAARADRLAIEGRELERAKTRSAEKVDARRKSGSRNAVGPFSASASTGPGSEYGLEPRETDTDGQAQSLRGKLMIGVKSCSTRVPLSVM